MLLVPQFKFNLISIKRLCEQLHSSIQFTDSICVLQAPSQKRPLVIGRDHQGLYILDRRLLEAAAATNQPLKNDQFSSCNHVFNMVSVKVWHQRLGHMSCNKMQIVSELGCTPDSIKDFLCEICPKAKQHRLPFPHSKTLSDHLFQLIHVDT